MPYITQPTVVLVITRHPVFRWKSELSQPFPLLLAGCGREKSWVHVNAHDPYHGLDIVIVVVAWHVRDFYLALPWHGYPILHGHGQPYGQTSPAPPAMAISAPHQICPDPGHTLGHRVIAQAMPFRQPFGGLVSALHRRRRRKTPEMWRKISGVLTPMNQLGTATIHPMGIWAPCSNVGLTNLFRIRSMRRGLFSGRVRLLPNPASSAVRHRCFPSSSASWDSLPIASLSKQVKTPSKKSPDGNPEIWKRMGGGCL